MAEKDSKPRIESNSFRM